MSFAAAERATTQPDATTDRAANALRQLRQNVALLERLCDMVDSAGPAGADAELRAVLRETPQRARAAVQAVVGRIGATTSDDGLQTPNLATYLVHLLA